ncbi:MAG: EAL domain-containing protein, partial [Atopobiaceae bacterium]|nr:EAL domain-containing protein [Atopobiaceae bacterium]
MDGLAIRVMDAAQDNTKDPLTGLLDHRAFRDLVDTLLESAEMNADVALVYFNVENFKHYNQRYGFAAGDTLLKHLATSISEAFPHAVAARFAADQFVVYAEASTVSQSVKKVRAAFRAEHKDASIWLRVGYYVLTPYDNDAGVACDRAKLACDELRGRRDAYICEYDNVLQHEIKWRRYVLEHFDEALENGWIRAWCQPIVRVATGETCDVEVLARWIDPTEGIMPPYEFIPVLEEARIVHRLDLAVLRDVCRSCRALEDAGKPYLSPSVNLSRLDFELCDIVTEVENVLEEYGIPRNRVAIEVTESALVGNREFLGDEIERFRSEGFEVWMD